MAHATRLAGLERDTSSLGRAKVEPCTEAGFSFRPCVPIGFPASSLWRPHPAPGTVGLDMPSSGTARLSVPWAIVISLALAVPSAAHAVTITSASCAQQADNVLRYDCTVTTDGLARVWIDLCEGSGCTFDRQSELSHMETTHEVTLWNLKPSTTYEWQATADDRTGSATDGPYGFTTSDLSDIDGDGVADLGLAGVQLSVWTAKTGPHSVENVLINWGCADAADGGSDYLIIADDEGNIVWYQDPSSVTGGETANLNGYTVGRDVNRIHAIIDHEYIVEYDLSGELVWLMCHCDAKGQCSSGDVPDTCFADYVHHDLIVRDGTLWALTAEDVSFPDVDDCDADPSTSEIEYVMDGVNAWILHGSQIIDWDMSEIYEPWTCGTESYWGRHLDGEDWAHANSLWVNGDQQWTISSRYIDTVTQVVGDPSDPDYGQIVWELSGEAKDASDDWELISSSYDAEFDWQHHAWWTLDGTMMLYDNNTMGALDSRVLEIEFDDSAMTAEIIGAYDLGTSCDGQGGAYDTQPGGSFVVNCSDDSSTPGATDPFIVEFPHSGSATTWEMDISCGPVDTTPTYRMGPMYRSVVFQFQH